MSLSRGDNLRHHKMYEEAPTHRIMKLRSTFLQKFAGLSASQGKCNGMVLLHHNNTILVQHEGVKQLPIYLTMTIASQLII